MAKKKSKQARRADEWAKQSKRSYGVNWDLVWKVLASISAFIVGIVAAYQLVDYFRSDSKTFYSIIFPGFVIVTWFIILFQLIRKKNPYAIVLLVVTVLGAVVGGTGWNSYNQTQEDKVIVLVAQFDGPEETYGLRRQMMEDLREATKEYDDIIIIEGDELVTSSEYAREQGEKAKADLVIWAWYRPTENPNITIHIENLSPTEIATLRESEVYQPQATLVDLESFEVQRQLGTETSTLVIFITGVVRYDAGDHQTAINRFEQVISENDISTFISRFDLFFYLGNSYFNLEQYEQAVQYDGKAIELDPKSEVAYINRGNAYDNLGDYERAIQDYNKAIELYPQLTAAYNNRGVTYAKLGDYERAILDFDKAIELDHTYIYSYNNRGISYNHLGEYERAIQDFDKAINLEPKFANAYNNRGTTYGNLGDYERAILDFDKTIEVDPESVNAYYNRGNAYLWLEQYERAIQDYDKVIELNPEFAWAYHGRGIVYSDLEQYERAIQDFDKAILLDPKDASSYYSRGNANRKLAQFERAIQDYDKAIDLNPEYEQAYNNRGLAYSKLEQYERAIQDYDRAIELVPEDEFAYYNRGSAYYNLGQFERAIQDYNRAIELVPEDADAYYWRGAALQSLGKTTEAEADFKKYEVLTGQKHPINTLP